MTEGKQHYAALAALAASTVALGGVLAASLALARAGGRQPPGHRRRTRLVRDDGLVKHQNFDDSEDEKVIKPKGRGPISHAAGDDEIFQCGWSMQEAMQVNEEGQARVRDLTPVDVLANLQRGNARFWTGAARRPEQTAFQRRALISKQFPTVAILGCSDSRVPLEIVFDQGLGDIFVIRVAGNCLRLPGAPPPIDQTYLADSATLASLQYAVRHLKVKVVIIMGHEGCGAVKASQLPIEAISKEPEYLRNLLTGLKSGLNLDRLGKIRDAKAHDREAVVTNVKRQVECLAGDQTVMDKVKSGEVLVVGAFYEISSGIVDFFHEVSQQSGADTDLTPTSRLRERLPSRGVLTRFEFSKVGTATDDNDAS